LVDTTIIPQIPQPGITNMEQHKSINSKYTYHIEYDQLQINKRRHVN